MPLKRCTKCGLDKDETDYSRRRINGPTLNQCKACMKDYQRAHYRSNKQQYLNRNRHYRKRVAEMIRELKQRPCADCGQSYPPRVMDFDHREGEEKYKDVARLTGNCSARVVLREIAKCDVVCANCHRQRTHERMITA